MALTQVKTLGIEDDAVTGAKIADDTVAEANMANDAIGLAELKAGTDGQIITFDASGNPAFVGPGSDGQVLTSTGAGSPPAFEDAAAGGIASLVADTSPQLGGDLDTNSFEISLDDSHKVKFGDGNDLQLYHDGTDNIIKNNGTVSLKITDTGGDVQFACHNNGATELYHNGTKKFETTSNGVNINGDTTADTWDQNVLIVGTENLALGRASADNAGGHVHFYKTRNATWGSNTVVQDNDALGNITWYGDDGTDYKSPAASIQAAVDGTPGSNDMPGRIVFKTTTDGSETLTERMRISSVGNAMGKGQIYVGDEEIRHTIEAGLTVHYDSTTAAAGALNLSRTGTGEVLSMGICNAYGKVGDIKTNGTSTSFNTSSDYRLKENEVAISDGITRIKQLKPYKFNFKTDKDKTLDGFFAHEVSSIVPQAVSGTKDQTKTTYYNAQDERDDNIPSGKKRGDVKDANAIDAQSIDHSHLVPLLTAALKEAIAKIETLETKVAALEAG